MKRCNTCTEESKDKFSFCPIDGTPLCPIAPATSYEFRLTLFSDSGLPQRLAMELSFLLTQSKQAWPSFRSDPVAFVTGRIAEAKRLLKGSLSRPHVLSGALTALLLVASVVLIVMMIERHHSRSSDIKADELSQTVTIDLSNEMKPRSESGVGAGEKGRVGFEDGKGEGSRPAPARAHGGGSGGMNYQLAPSQGRPPQPSAVPAPIPTTFARIPPQALPAAGIDIDPALWKNLAFSSYGDPRSQSKTPSNGPGNGGGVGTNNGSGIGEGDGPGFGPGKNGNIGGGPKSPGGGKKGGGSGDNPDDPDRVFTSPQVTERARVLSKPEPQYTEEARRADITGAVVLRVVFSKSGEVTNIRTIKPLPFGLTEKAIAAARLIRFVPAKRNGQPVSMYMQLEYNFNLY